MILLLQTCKLESLEMGNSWMEGDTEVYEFITKPDVQRYVPQQFKHILPGGDLHYTDVIVRLSCSKQMNNSILCPSLRDQSMHLLKDTFLVLHAIPGKFLSNPSIAERQDLPGACYCMQDQHVFALCFFLAIQSAWSLT